MGFLGGEASVEIDAPIDVVWPVVEDPELDALSDTGAGMGGLAVRLDSGWNHAS